MARCSAVRRPAAVKPQVSPWRTISILPGDFIVIGAANNLLAAMLDNHISRGIRWISMYAASPGSGAWIGNDRQLRNIVCGLGGKGEWCAPGGRI